jgi:digeranylgeranylglycerophospholipid reductase
MTPSMAYDALVVGGGPGGLYAAWRLALEGLSVVVCEEHPAIGVPVHCTGVLGTDSFEEFELPRGSILNSLPTIRFVSPAGLEVSYTPPDVQAVVVDRGQFDGTLAEWARSAGAELRANARVTALDITDAGVHAVAGGRAVSARIAILACGASYALQRRFGLGVPRRYLHTAQREVPVRTLRDVEVHFGHEVAPGGFAWAVPVERPDGPHVRIGAMATRGADRCYARMCARIAATWGIAGDRGGGACGGEYGAPRLKFLPLGPIDRTFANRLLVIGDAAGLVKPTTGGGIYYSIVSGSLAADVARHALTRDRLDAASLSTYEARWRGHLSGELTSQAALREAAEAMSDPDIDALFDLAKTDGIMPIVRKTARFNQHRHLIRALFNHAPARKVLLRAFAG